MTSHEKKRLAELERRVKELEARPQMPTVIVLPASPAPAWPYPAPYVGPIWVAPTTVTPPTWTCGTSSSLVLS
jgi:hypothetical protein